VEPVPAAVVTAIGVYLLLTSLAVLVQVDLAPGQFSRIGLALVAAAAAYLERRYRQRKWQQAYRNAFGEIKAERKGTDESGS
jgi:membrane protein implicated in regulation of membrane protease activity